MASDLDATLARSDAYRSSAGLRQRVFLHGRNPASLICVVPFAIAVGYLVVFVARWSQIMQSVTSNSDVASAFTIPATLIKTGTGGHTVLSSTGAYVSLWFGLLTASLPLHRELWEIAPTAVSLAAALTIGWSVSQVATRRAAMLAVALAVVVSPAAFSIFMAAATHNIVYLGTALLGAYLVWLARAHRRRRVTVFVVPLLAGIALGVCLASDLLLLATAIVPFAFTAMVGGLQRSRRSTMLVVSALTTVAVAVPAALLTSTIMGSFGFIIVRPSTTLAPLSALPLHSEYLFEGIKQLSSGPLGGPGAPGGLREALGTASDVVTMAALLTLALVGAWTVARLMRSGLRRHAERTSPDPLAAMHLVYWSGSAVSTALAFLLSVKADTTHPQYYTTLVFSVAAVLPVLMHRAARGGWLVPAGASILFTASLVGLTSPIFGQSPLGQDEPTITRLAEANDATTGYTGYWYASSLTWSSRERVKVRPVAPCENPLGADICPFYINRVPSWYTPMKRRTFLLVNPEEGFLDAVPRGLGRPLASYSVGNSTTMYVYPYDIAARLGPAPD